MEKEGFAGWDPFDGLNSPYLKDIPRIHRWAGVAVLQCIKRSPINLRPILNVPKTINAKGMGLILAASVYRYQLWSDERDMTRALFLADWLEKNKAPTRNGAGWGYAFDWPNRAFYAPRGTPTIVNTAVIGHALLNLYKVNGEDRWLNLTIAACDFICRDLRRIPDKKGFCFSYTPIDQCSVHNANLLGASLLARVGKTTNRPELLNTAMESTAFSIALQKQDGSWPYGTAPNQDWIDSFHTGYNILALRQIKNSIATQRGTFQATLDSALENGYRYYLDHFFLPDGTVKYYHNKVEPLDAHAFAHALICLMEMADQPATPPELADKVLARMIDLFWSGTGYFYWRYANGKFNRLPCMRWVQAWALLGLVTYLLNHQGKS
jgi:hypothetical protein